MAGIAVKVEFRLFCSKFRLSGCKMILIMQKKRKSLEGYDEFN